MVYRSLRADKWYVGTEVREDKSPFGKPLYLDIQTLDFTLTYGASDRTTLTLTVPLSHGTHSRYYADGQRHEVSASGLGDISLIADRWLSDPETASAGNLSLGLGVKAPTGKNDVEDDWFIPAGSFDFPVDQSIQLGDGGWGAIFRGQGFRRLRGSGFGYAGWSYLLTPQNTTGVTFGPGGRKLSVPDVYYVRLGLAWTVSAKHGLSAAAGGRLDGIPEHDLVGGSDGFRRPVVLGYADPTLSYAWSGGVVSLNVPVLVYQDFERSSGGGDLADYLIFLGYQYSF